MKFELNVAKYEDHVTAYDLNYETFPTIRLFIDGLYALGISIYKWEINEGSNKGKYIATKQIGNFVKKWEDIDIVSINDLIETSINDIIEFNKDDIMYSNIDEVIVFKFSVNTWRLVQYKKTKWGFVDIKPDKDVSKLQRLIN